MRTKVIQAALHNPFFSKASRAYSEQVGVNLQAAGSIGEMNRWYSRMRVITNRFIIYDAGPQIAVWWSSRSTAFRTRPWSAFANSRRATKTRSYPDDVSFNTCMMQALIWRFSLFLPTAFASFLPTDTPTLK